MANQDNKPHFDVSAAVIRQLGEELVTDEVTAIMELIKNSYDADADWVKVEINLNEQWPNDKKYYKDSNNGYILLEDNGFGMSDDDIWTKWMKISLSFKKKFKEEGKTTPKGRTPLGEKGVGRLSTQRLGSRLELLTGKEHSDKENHVAFDWDNFDEDTSLTSVPVYINDFPKALGKKGTSLIVTNLKESNKWKGESWDKFRGQISQMIFPFKEKRVFNVYLKLNGQNVDLDEVNQSVRDNSAAKYSFKLTGNKITLDGIIKLQKLSGSNKKDDQLFFEQKVIPDFGKDFFSYLTDKKENKKNFVDNVDFSGEKGVFITFRREIELSNLSNISYVETEGDENDVSFSELPQIEVAHPGDFDGEIDDFYFKESQEIESAFDSLSEFKRIVQNQVGVRIFRDGFGIKPYGIDGQDWLKLSSNQTSGGSFYGLRPGNVVGYVIISAKNNKNLREKTDREGFMDSPYSRNFFRIMDYFISEINTLLEGTRRSFGTYRSEKAIENTGIRTITDSFNKITQTSSNAKNNSEKIKRVTLNLNQAAFRISKIVDDEKNNKTHNDEVNNILSYLGSILEEAKKLLSEVESTVDEAKVLDKYVEFLEPQIRNLEQQLSDFSELAGLGLTAEALSHELSNIVDRIIEETDKINKKLKNSTEEVQFKVYIEYINSATRSFKKQLSHLDSSLRYVREVKETIVINKFVTEIQDYFQDRFKGAIRINLIFTENNFQIKVNKGKLIQVVDNIIINSEYWLNEVKKGMPTFEPLITIEVKEPFLRIYDNGRGVDPNIQDRIFQPFISGKPKNQGRGLGLFIIQQLLESLGCDITLLNAKNQYERKYIFQINLSNIIEK